MVTIVTITVTCSLNANTPGDTPKRDQHNTGIAAVPIAFTENLGQWDEQILFRAGLGEATMWFARDRVYYHVIRFHSSDATEMPELAGSVLGEETDLYGPAPRKADHMWAQSELIGRNANVEVTGALTSLGQYSCQLLVVRPQFLLGKFPGD